FQLRQQVGELRPVRPQSPRDEADPRASPPLRREQLVQVGRCGHDAPLAEYSFVPVEWIHYNGRNGIEGDAVTETRARPPFDAELLAGLDRIGYVAATVTREMLPRPGQPRELTPIEIVDALLAERGLVRRDVTVPGYRGDDI